MSKQTKLTGKDEIIREVLVQQAGKAHARHLGQQQRDVIYPLRPNCHWFSQVLLERLARKDAQGVEVYVVFDSFGNTVVPHAFKVFPPTIHVLPYQAIRRPWQLLDLRRYALDHRKLLIVDSSASFIGGFNLGSLYATAWRDTHLRISGPAAADLAQSFIDFWNGYAPVLRRITRHYARRVASLCIMM